MTSLMFVCHWVTDGEKNFWIIWKTNNSTAVCISLFSNFNLKPDVLSFWEDKIDNGREDEEDGAAKMRKLIIMMVIWFQTQSQRPQAAPEHEESAKNVHIGLKRRVKLQREDEENAGDGSGEALQEIIHCGVFFGSIFLLWSRGFLWRCKGRRKWRWWLEWGSAYKNYLVTLIRLM